MARLIDADALGVGLCSRDVLPADYCAGRNGLIMLRLLENAPTVDAVPIPELIELRDRLNEDRLIAMRGLRDFNMLIAKYEGAKDNAT